MTIPIFRGLRPLKPLSFKEMLYYLPIKYSRGILPLFRGVSRRDRVFPLRIPELQFKVIIYSPSPNLSLLRERNMVLAYYII
jgi:hypothetical protein